MKTQQYDTDSELDKCDIVVDVYIRMIMLLQQIIKLILVVVIIGESYIAFCILIPDVMENSTISAILEKNYTVKTSSTLVPRSGYTIDLMTTQPPTPIKRTAKLFNKGSQKKKHKDDVDVSSVPIEDVSREWMCPNISDTRSIECACDLPHTLRCNGDVHGLTILAEHLRTTPYSVALLDISLKNVTFLSDARIFDNVSLRCLIISSGEIKRVHKSAFFGIKGPLLALGLPGNALISVPWSSINAILVELERLDLSNNKIKALGTSDLAALSNLEYLDLSKNQLSSISQRTFVSLRKLEILKLGGNRLGDYAFSLKALTQCFNLRDLDISANNINGPLRTASLPVLKNLASLNLNRNLIKSIQNKAFENFSKLQTLFLRHNQIDVLQDHAFYGLGSLETLDLSYNGIVAISSASLQHLTRLTTLDLTHNFLRALTSDLITPLPSLIDLRLSGNDISIVARNALDGALELRSISMQENPLSCDCTIREFADWLQTANLMSQDLLTITCATPPKLEGAPLIQVPIEMLNCDMENAEKDNANIIEQLEAFAKKNHSIHSVKDLSDDIHCESKIINGQNTVSVIVPDSSSLDIGESYRFCLVMVQEYNPHSDITVGCSNITLLQISNPGNLPKTRQFKRRPYADFTKFDRSIEPEYKNKNALALDFTNNGRKFLTKSSHEEEDIDDYSQRTYNFLNSLNKSFLPGIGLGILVTSVLVLIWGALRLRHKTSNNNHNSNNTHISRRSSSPSATTCYAASEHIARIADSENRTRYLKLQATTSL
ncbi:Reticulon-4 receptor-like 2 [Lucilia cuprina]|nr:Reticulon-4 receptor-like 2 [Lucilia cuprina]